MQTNRIVAVTKTKTPIDSETIWIIQP